MSAMEGEVMKRTFHIYTQPGRRRRLQRVLTGTAEWAFEEALQFSRMNPSLVVFVREIHV
jgi:hypothetical protein